jgi:hypothetical protein
VVVMRFLVDCRGKSIDAVVVKTPFYKRNDPGKSPAGDRGAA